MIAEVARTAPKALRTPTTVEETETEPAMLIGFDQNLAGESTHTSNERPAEEIADAADGRGTRHPRGDRHLPSLARQLAEVLEQHRMLEGRLSALLEAHPLSPLLISMPGVGVRTAATILTAVGDGSTFSIADRLASYAGLALATTSSGGSIRGEHAPRRGIRQLEGAMFLSAFAALSDPDSRTYYDRQRTSGKTHTQAILRPARRRINVLHAMLRDGAFYTPRRA